MTARGSLYDDYFLRPVRLFTAVGIVGVLSSVLSKPFGTSVIIGYMPQTVSYMCASGRSTPKIYRARSSKIRQGGSLNLEPTSTKGLLIRGTR